jgi:hypothetical protein
MEEADNEDLSKLIRQLIDRQKSRADREKAQEQSTALVVVPKSRPTDDRALGGDPRNAYRELRRYLLEMGIDSRVFSFGTIPVPAAVCKRKGVPAVAVDVGSIDNCFFFEMRKVVEANRYGDTVNALIIMFRVFFEGGQDSTNFWVQAVLNHHHDAIFETNELYGKTIIPALKAGCWSHPTAGSENTRISYLEKRYTSVTAFKREFNDMYSTFRAKGMRGNHIEPPS